MSFAARVPGHVVAQPFGRHLQIAGPDISSRAAATFAAPRAIVPQTAAPQARIGAGMIGASPAGCVRDSQSAAALV